MTTAATYHTAKGTASCSFSIVGSSQRATCCRTVVGLHAQKFRRNRTYSTSREFICRASVSRESAGKESDSASYDIPPLVVSVDATRRRSDRLAAILGVIALLFWGYRSRTQIAGWITANVYKLDIPGCLGLLTTVAGVTVFCKERFYMFWGQQQRRLACVDAIPAMARDITILKQDVSTLKQDVTVIKDDVAEIKNMMSRRSWFKL